MQYIKNISFRMFNKIFNKEKKYQAKPEVKEDYSDDVLAADQSGIDIVINNLLEIEGNRSGHPLYIISEEYQDKLSKFVYHKNRIVMAKK